MSKFVPLVLVVAVVVGCGGVAAVQPDASGAAGSSAAGSSGAGSAGTSGGAGTGSAGGGAGVTGAAGAAAGSGGSVAGGAGSIGATGAAGTTGAAGNSGAAGTGAALARCIHNYGPIVVTGLCPGKPTCSKSCSCDSNSPGAICRSDNSSLSAQLPCEAAAEYVGDQPGAGKQYYPPNGLLTGFCNGAGTQCTSAQTMTCVADCAGCP